MSNRQESSSAGLSFAGTAPQGALVALPGDLNFATMGRFEEGTKTALSRDSDSPVVLDLRAVGRIDNTGLVGLVRMAALLKPRRRTLSVLVSPESQVERALYVGRLHRLMDVVHSPEEVAAGGLPVEPASAAPAQVSH